MENRRPSVRWAAPLAIIALLVALLGGYVFRWGWTGVSEKQQLWDVLHVIVVPIALSTLPLWYRTRTRWRIEWRVVLAGASLVFALLVVGGYRMNWSWTGFQGNTLWDWLELLALPVVIASLPLWFDTHRRWEGRWRVAGVTLVIAFAVVIVGGYALDWAWTGFPGNTFWDWLRLLLVPFLLPVTLVWFAPQPPRGASVDR